MGIKGIMKIGFVFIVAISGYAQLSDPMIPGNWTKYPTAILSESAVNKLWGPGHACFTRSPDGKEDWIVYHAKISSSDNTDRLACTQQFLWANDSTPDLGSPKGKISTIASPSGQTLAVTFSNPIKSTPSPDPMVYKHTDGYYYGLHTVFVNGTGYIPRIDLYRSKNLTDVFNNGSQKTIWNAPTSGWNTTDIWAPELHCINNAWYIYYAGGGKTGVFSCSKANPYATTTADWTSTRLVSNIDDWAIDGTVLEANGNLYFIWSGIDAQTAGVQKLFLSKMSSPTKLTGNRITISIPQYSWEKQGTSTIHDVNEGPFILKHNGKVMCVYSASFCETHYYCLGMLRLAGKEPATTIVSPASSDKTDITNVLVTRTSRSFTVIDFTLPVREIGKKVFVGIYTTRGDFVAKIGGCMAGVENRIAWNGFDRQGRLVAPGMYVVRLTVGGMNRSLRFALN